ncbi:MAG: DNA internalization-related competence protein ComEC/Rec2 [Oscillospiraceae bacterium]|nr:DNA internalization-related competence protein ComEC/Rec2 [Oscillospiraceae bacterium]
MRKVATAALAFTAAIFFSRYIIPYDWLLIASAIAAAVSLVGLLFHGNMRLRVLIALISAAIGLGWSWGYTALFLPSTIDDDDLAASVTAVVTDHPYERTRGYRVDCLVYRDNKPSVGARLYYYDDLALSPGDIIEFSARFQRTDGMDDSGRIDALSARGAFLTGYVSGGITVTGSNNSLLFFPKRLANSVADMIDTIFEKDVSPLIQAVTVGKRDGLNQDAALSSALSASGIAHFFSISGMHISFLMGFLSLVIKNKRYFAIAGIPILLFFMAMTGFTPSISRAGIMQFFLICAPLFNRESDSLTSLSASLVVLLAANPYSCASVGLQLSFATTVGIIVFTTRINSSVSDLLRGKKFNKNKIIKKIVAFITSSLSATVGALVFSLPLTALHFGYVSLIGPLTNLLTLWALTIVFPLGILASILGFVYIPLAAIVAYPASLAARYIIAVARAFASIPYASIYPSSAHIIFWIAYVYVLFITLPLLKARARQYLYPACIAVVLLCAVLLVSHLLPNAGDSSMTVLDVGQGLCVVLNSDGNTAVVDCGSSSGEDAGAIAHAFLQNHATTSIDLLVLTHLHSDHANGVLPLLSRVNISAIAIPDPEGSYIADDIIELARKRGTDIIYVTETLGISLGGIDLVMYPPVGFGDDNERGLTILCKGEISALITGDMNSSIERSLLRFAQLPYVDTLVVGHHGSKYSTSEELLYAIRPKLAIISVGKNSYGHPSEETLDRLNDYSVAVFRTDTTGHVTVGAGNRKVAIQE